MNILRCLAERLDDAFSAPERPHPADPATPREMGDEYGDQRDHDTEYDEHADQIAPGVSAAPFDETHVVDEDQRPDSFRALKHRMLNDVQRPLPQANDRVALARGIGRPAPERGRIGRCLVAALAGFVTVGKRVETLVLYRAHKKAIDLRSTPLSHQRGG